MKFRPVTRMKVVLDLEGQEREPGVLAWSSRERKNLDTDIPADGGQAVGGHLRGNSHRPG